MNLVNQFLGYMAFLVVWATSSLVAQEITYEQQMDDLDAKATALSKRLADSEERSQRMNAFVAQARARLEALRAGRVPGEPIQWPAASPTPATPTPAAPIVELDKGKPVEPPFRPRSKKGYYLQTFGSWLFADQFRVAVTEKAYDALNDVELSWDTKRPIQSHTGFSTGVVFGRDFGRFRLESEFSMRKYSHKTMDVRGLQYHDNKPGYANKEDEYRIVPSSSNFKNASIDGYASMFGGQVTALYDIDLTDTLGFFWGVGTGVSGAKIKLGNLKYKDTLFSYQLLSGVEWEFTKRASLRFLYKYFTTAGSKDFDRLDSHNLELGMQVDL